MLERSRMTVATDDVVIRCRGVVKRFGDGTIDGKIQALVVSVEA